MCQRICRINLASGVLSAVSPCLYALDVNGENRTGMGQLLRNLNGPPSVGIKWVFCRRLSTHQRMSQWLPRGADE